MPARSWLEDRPADVAGPCSPRAEAQALGDHQPGTDFDLLGPLATGLLRAHGLLWPALGAIFLPMIDAVGDGYWSPARAATKYLGSGAWGGSGAPLGKDGGCARACGRSWGRRCQIGCGDGVPCLAPSPTRAGSPGGVDGAAGGAGGRSSGRSPAVVARLPPRGRSERGLRLGERTYATICASRGGSLATPLKSPTFLSALARCGGRLGLGDRTSVMRALFSPLLDDTILSRASKATFAGVHWARPAGSSPKIGTAPASRPVGST